MKVLAAVVILMAVSLAGCADDAPPTTVVETDDGEEKEIAVGKGGILGLVIDDRFRPIPGALVLIQPAGVTVTANNNGEFEVNDLDPGAYSLRVSAEGHEAAPETVNVEEGKFTEKSLLARRTLSEGGQIATQEFSVFIPCAADFVVNGVVANCVLDLSGDTYRAGFNPDFSEAGENITFLVIEMKSNAVGNYAVQFREDDGSSAGGNRYVVGTALDTDYHKMVLERGVVNTEFNEQNNNVAWNNTEENPAEVIMFMQGDYKGEIEGAGSAACVDPEVQGGTGCNWRGVGAQFGIKAQFILSAFIDEPEVDVNSYCVLC